MKVDKDKIEELLTRGVDEVIDLDSLRKKLQAGKKLRVKLGIDPTSSNIHLGRMVPLLKLRDFQELGHQIVFIVGDFTGTIGDTSDKEAERPAISKKMIEDNLRTYIDQVARVIDIDKVEVHYNSEWLAKLKYEDIGEQANQFSLAEFISRKNIKDRLDKGNRVSLKELLYPLMQGYDSVMVKADVELGGTDQRFNLLAGRNMQEHYKQPAQDILMTNLIEGLDGRKMSSSWGNTINFNDPAVEMFGKVMKMTDEMIVVFYEHCTRVPMTEVKQYETDMRADKVNPRDIKMKLAREITSFFWGVKEAEQAEDSFVSMIQNKEVPDDMPELSPKSNNIVDVLIEAKLAKSKSDARRLIDGGGVKVNDDKVGDYEIELKSGDIVKKGKRFFVKIK
ncbi:tyrosine--tRNA ligase [Candidatus Parcubacteria bacterium]|jgi:tyrosyl-tRNA synthetase|nr:tyrosine--tRNA ligase [Candidatus Parcubacteria bacterium]